MAEIAIAGAGGRMGRMLVQTVVETAGCRLVAASEASGADSLGRDAGEVAGVGSTGVIIQPRAEHLFESGWVVIDFTMPQATMRHVELARGRHTGMVIGTTGLKDHQLQAMTAAARDIPIVFAPNFSIGVNLMFKVAAQVAKTLGEPFDIEIIEAHHRHKVDAPSGTALGLGRAIAEARQMKFEDAAVFAREGHTGARVANSIGFATVRGGDIVGDHTVMFAGEGERFEITHKASSRMTFARGAVKAALWLSGKPPGLYTMGDVLGF
ncbi:MAG: 4-hydroxy-tetrahydrodipicolinate reductase [Magnetococcales bacterium]|nr:4-hydroxy-tetrahydrodipicolinate reductase [Magnetococcales bacterium]MBF0149863.1 4-hydroxy-tetrahydrodipicolinate reductase [Magnetococcales bacterium]